MNKNSPDQSNDLTDELSLLDIIEFVQEYWKTIAGFTVLGIVGASIYLWVVPKQYEATAQIKMMPYANFNNRSTSINDLVINFEDPQTLIARMMMPTSYPKEIIALCGLADQRDPEVSLARKVKLSIPNKGGEVINLNIRDASKEIAKACANAVYQLIKTSQDQLVAPYINEARKKLKIEEERLSRITQVITNDNKSGAEMSAVFLFMRDEIRYLRERIANLQNIITISESRAAHLTAPIYLNDQPVFPQKNNSLLIGFLLGVLLGLGLALTRKWYRFNYLAPKRLAQRH
jgi:capsular polysaccharide biosynthesis protein